MIIHSTSLQGKRESNEDQHKIFVNIDNDDTNLTPINLFSIFDGHGGKDISKYLGNNLHLYFTSKFNKFDSLSDSKKKNHIVKVYDHIESKLEKILRNKSYNIGSTSISLIFYKHNNKTYYYVINVGDCRAILCNNEGIPLQLSKDHKPHMFDEKNRIEKLNGKIYYDGYDWRISDLSVSRAFGDIDAFPYVTHKPEIFKYKLKKNDKFFILACDGLWDVISNQDACNFVLQKLNETSKISTINGNSKNNIAQALAEYAIKNGSTDNVSVILIFLITNNI